MDNFPEPLGAIRSSGWGWSGFRRRGRCRAVTFRLPATGLLLIAASIPLIAQTTFATEPVDSAARSQPPQPRFDEQRSGSPRQPLSSDAVSPAAVFMEIEAEPERPYLYARVRYRVRILARVPLRQAVLSEPSADGAVIRRIGEDRRSDLERDGVRYRVLERLYAIVPQRIGALRVGAPRLSAAVPAESLAPIRKTEPADGPAPVFERLETVVRVGPELVLDVRPIPIDSLSSWLPAESLSVAEQWRPAREEIRVGEPLTRTLLIEASGLLAGSIPTLTAEEIEGFRVYSQVPAVREQVSGDDLLVTAEFKQTLVPTLAGAWEVPAVRLPWWSLGMDEARQASLPARQVRVIDAPYAPGAEEPDPAAHASARERFIASAFNDLWGAPLLALVFAFAWILTLMLWFRERRRGMLGRRGLSSEAGPPAEGGGDALRDLQRAMRSADARAARRALLDWGRRRWPVRPPRGPVELMFKLDADAAAVAAAIEIERSLYGHEPQHWDAESARDPILTALADADRERQPDEVNLPGLYPAG